ncbi:MAG: STAS domain-containing protein [Cyclobacteriaceae bacterium]|nr:STAS domain-containing protein [Cyclobacteriaceae bacterium]
MKFKIKIAGKATVVSISEDITSMYDSKDLIAAVEENLNVDNRNIILDLAEVNYINSAGINVLLTVLTSVRNKEGELVLASISEKVKSLLVITKLNSIFTVKNSVEESLQFINELESLIDQQETK